MRNARRRLTHEERRAIVANNVSVFAPLATRPSPMRSSTSPHIRWREFPTVNQLGIMLMAMLVAVWLIWIFGGLELLLELLKGAMNWLPRVQ